jgi:acetylglutamate kinase
MKLVVKLSGKVLEDEAQRLSLSRQISRLVQEGTRLVIVHGGGKQLSTLCKKLDIPVVQYAGRRVTDAATLEAAKMVFSSTNRDITASLISCGVRAAGIAAFDGHLVHASRRPPISVANPSGNSNGETVDFGLVASIQSVDPSLIETLWDGGCVPVVSCLCTDANGQILNINADTLAAELALALDAERLISVSDVDGIYRDPTDASTRISSLSLRKAQHYLARGVFLDGMIPKVQAAIGVLERGLPSFQVISGLQEDALLAGTENRGGTLISR